jgi:hypothetical protein
VESSGIASPKELEREDEMSISLFLDESKEGIYKAKRERHKRP